MTITTGRSSKSPSGGFSLIELLIVISLGSIMFAAVMSSFVFMGRSSIGIANYSIMNTESRTGLEYFSRDVRSANDILPGFSATEFTVVVPDWEGGASEEVTYVYRPGESSRPLIRQDSEGERAVMTQVEELEFKYYNLQEGAANVPLEVQQVQLQLTLLRKTIALDNTEKVVSARYILRNKRVSN